MTPRARLTEDGKVWAMMFLFPIFWPFIPIMALVKLIEWIGEKVRDVYWRWKYRKVEKSDDAG